MTTPRDSDTGIPITSLAAFGSVIYYLIERGMDNEFICTWARGKVAELRKEGFANGTNRPDK